MMELYLHLIIYILTISKAKIKATDEKLSQMKNYPFPFSLTCLMVVNNPIFPCLVTCMIHLRNLLR